MSLTSVANEIRIISRDILRSRVDASTLATRRRADARAFHRSSSLHRLYLDLCTVTSIHWSVNIVQCRRKIMAMDEDDRRPLFEGVTVAIIPDERIEADFDAILSAIETNGGKYVPLRVPDQQIDKIATISHIISNHIDFPQYNEAIERGISIVKPSWVEQSLKRSKLAGPRQHSPDPSQYFQDVVVSFAEIPEGDKDAIVAGVLALGGQYSSPLTRFVTHLVTLDMGHNKCSIAQDKVRTCKIVLPHWFDVCLKLGKLIREEPYMFPDPPLLRFASSKPSNSESPHIQGAITAIPSGTPSKTALDSPPPSPSNARKNLNAFMGRKIKLSEDLELSSHMTETLDSLINHGGGVLTNNIHEADLYIGKYRDGSDYVTAARAGKEVANLSWLYHVINRNKYTNPVSKLLHYPVPRNGIPGFENMRISISNYNGDARVYLENLITHCGAQFTKTMKQDNTHLITAHTHSEKCEAAQEWNINMINHLWIEESYAKCAVQSLTNPRYTTFPSQSHLGEVCGQTMLDMTKVEQIYYPKRRASPHKFAQPPIAQISHAAPRKTVSASSLAPIDSETASDHLDTARTIDADTQTEGEREQQPEPHTVKKPRARACKPLATPRLVDDEKENESPIRMSSGRASKAKALDILHHQADDIALYQREMKRKGGVTHGVRRSSRAEDFSSPMPLKTRKKRKSDEITFDVSAEGRDHSDGETQYQPSKTTKKPKHHALESPELLPIKYRMMVTGDDRWLGKPKDEDVAKFQLRKLGIQLTQNVGEVDILVAPKILRTRKFVAALASAPLVVHTKYLDTALKQGKLMEIPPILQDRDTEERLGFRLKDALERARLNQHQLFRGWPIFVTKDAPGGYDTFREIIELNGGDVYLYQGRTGLTLPKPLKRQDATATREGQSQGDEDSSDHVYLVSGTSEAEVKLWKAFHSLAERQAVKARIVKTDWLLNAAMSQRVVWDEKWMLSEELLVSQRDR